MCETVADACPIGFFCPYNNEDHPPQICPPSTTCVIQRLYGISCNPQGLFEPTICAAGYYCPIGGKLQSACPDKHFCPRGSYEPLPCEFGAICPPGSDHPFSPFLAYLCIPLDALVLMRLGFLTFRQKRQAKWRAKKEKVDEEAPAPTERQGGQRLCDLPLNTDGVDESSGTLRLRPLPKDYQRPVYIPAPARCTRKHFPAGSVPPRLRPPDENAAAVLTFMGKLREEVGLAFEFTTPDQPQVQTIPRGAIVGIIGPDRNELIAVLAGRQGTAPGITDIRVNGHPVHPRTYRNLIAHVPEHNTSTALLTVHENILVAARRSMPSTVSRAEINQTVEAIMATLDLTDIRDDYVGSPDHQVISPAQRRLVDIAMALASGPTAIFLTEPTNHMNPVQAQAFFNLLRHISLQGITIAVAMAHPDASIQQNLILGQPAKISAPMSQQPTTVEDCDRLEQACRSRERHLNYLVDTAISSALLAWREPGAALSRGVAAAGAGALVALSARVAKGQPFRGILLPPFERLSAGVDYKSAPAVGSLGSLAIGAVAAASGVRFFMREKSTQKWQSPGETLATIHRPCVSSLHFTAVLAMWAAPTMSLAQMYVANLMCFWAADSLAGLLEVVLEGETWGAVARLVLVGAAGLTPWWPLAIVKTWHLEWLWRCSPAV